MTTDELNVEKAEKYLESARINQENLWKRRQIEWKIYFTIWTILSLGTGYIYLYANRPLPATWKCPVLFMAIITYIFIIVIQIKHLMTIFVSNEKDLDYMRFCQKKAGWLLNPVDYKNVEPEIPKWAGKVGDLDKRSTYSEFLHYYRRSYARANYYFITLITPTIILALFSFFILLLLFSESANPGCEFHQNINLLGR